MPGKTLVILGSGPGIGIAVAKVFSVRGFTHVALVSRNKERLAQDEDNVLDAIQERGYSCRVKTWVCDISDLKQLNATLKEIESFGSLECVLFNPARVAGKPPLEESSEAIEADFRVCLPTFQTMQVPPTDMQSTAHEHRSSRDCEMGHPIAEASPRRQPALAVRYKHHSALQGASPAAGIAFDGQVCSALACVVSECPAWQGGPHWSCVCGRCCEPRCKEPESGEHRRAGIQAV
jgi:NAD(P)-dependent dehydrogenase (short-subunit alcohol dehydrogenase family)